MVTEVFPSIDYATTTMVDFVSNDHYLWAGDPGRAELSFCADRPQPRARTARGS